MGNYSSGDVTPLPTTTDDLEHIFDATDLANVSSDNGVRVGQSASGQYAVFQFKDTITGSPVDITWNGQSDRLPSSSPIVLQVYNVSTSTWETLQANQTASVNTDFNITYTISNTANYLSSGVMTCRVYQGATFTLKDTFQTDLPTGINGTLCDTGQARTVVDTLANLWFYNKQAHAQGNTGSFGNPGLWYPQQASRILGQATFFHVRKNADTTSGPMIGWSTATSGNTILTGVYLRGASNRIHSVNTATTAGPIIGVWAKDTDYYFCLITRQTGHWIFIKGGAWTNWTLLYYDKANATANLFPCIEWVSTETTNYPLSKLFGIAGETITPTVLASDSFSQGNTNIDGQTTDGLGDSELSGGSGLAWTNQIGTVVVNTNHIKASAVTGSVAIATVDVGKSNVFAKLDTHAIAGNQGIVCRYIDDQNYILAYYTQPSPYNIMIDQMLSGSLTNLATVVLGSLADVMIGVYCVGNTIRLYGNNNNTVFATATMDASFANATKFGYYTSSTNASAYSDNFVIWAAGGSELSYDAVLDPYITLPTPGTVVLTNSLVGGGNAYKVQTHCHASGAPDDGAQTITDLVTAYQGAGYNAVCVTGHNVIHAAPDPPIADITLIQSVEETTSVETNAHHVGHISASADIASMTAQQTIDYIMDTEVGGGKIAVVNHPNASTLNLTYSNALVVQLTRYTMMEIWNAYTDSNNAGQGDGTTKVKYALSRGKRFFLNAVDDCHNTTEPGGILQFNRAWDVVNAASTSASDIIAAYKAGNFYPTQGPVITSVVTSGATITVNVPADCTFAWYGFKNGVGAALTADGGGTARTSSYTCDGTEICVYCTITRTADSLLAWTQPVWVSNS